ncbi:unnamed protein product, partial [marine sediment metagenome]
ILDSYRQISIAILGTAEKEAGISSQCFDLTSNRTK